MILTISNIVRDDKSNIIVCIIVLVTGICVFELTLNLQ